jgi:PAS domain S-box-containing protein
MYEEYVCQAQQDNGGTNGNGSAMTNMDSRPGEAAELRKRAEESVRERSVRSPENIESMSPVEIRRMLDELHVHQIELEMQNEELRRTQVELNTAQAQYFDFFDFAPVGYATVSEKGMILEANLTAANLLGVSRDVLIKQPISRFIFKEDQDIYYLHRKRLFETGEVQSCEVRMMKNHGTVFWAWMKTIVVQNAQGVPVSRVVLNDITKRKRAEEARDENRERMRAIVEGTPHLFFYTQDAEANTTYVSPTVEIITGHKVDTWLKRGDWFSTDAAINQAAKERTHANLRGEFIEEPILVEVRHALGHPILLEVCEYPITKDGRVVGLQGVAHDITERKRAEDQLRRNLDEKQVLLREVHHRVKNNLTVISSLLNMQSSAIQTPEQAMVAFKNSRDRIAAMALVHERLYESEDYARVDMSEYLEDLIRQLSRAYGCCGNIVINTQVDGIFLGVDAAIPSGLIATELITNAFKHAFPDGRAGEIRLLLREVDDGSVELSVSDSGIGLPAGYEGRETLGLNLVHLLIEQLEGTVNISTEIGTRFVIRFPRKADRMVI